MPSCVKNRLLKFFTKIERTNRGLLNNVQEDHNIHAHSNSLNVS